MTDFDTLQEYISNIQFTYKKGWYRESDVDSFIDKILGMIGEVRSSVAEEEKPVTNEAAPAFAGELHPVSVPADYEKIKAELAEYKRKAAEEQSRDLPQDYEELCRQLADMKAKESAIAAVMVRAEQTAAETVQRGQSEADRLIAEAKAKCTAYEMEAQKGCKSALSACNEAREQLQSLENEKTAFIEQIYRSIESLTERMETLKNLRPKSLPEEDNTPSAEDETEPAAI